MGNEIDALKSRVAAFRSRDYDVAALAVIERILELEPANVYQRFLRADTLRIIGRKREAEAELRDVLPRVPEERRYNVHLSLGRLYADSGRFPDAERQYRLAMSLDPSTTVPFVLLAGILSGGERLSEAYAVLESGLRAEGDLDEVLLNMGNVKRAMGKYDEARLHYAASLKHSPGYEPAHRALADLNARDQFAGGQKGNADEEPS